MAKEQPQRRSFAWSTGDAGGVVSPRATTATSDAPASAIRVRDYRPSDLREVVAIDEATLKGFMMTRLGKKFVAQYYSLVDSYPRRIFFVAESGDGRLVGFIAGFVWPTQFYQHAAAARQRLTLAAIPALLRRPFAGASLARESRRAEEESWADAPIDPARCELAAVAVHPDSARRGIGKRLVHAFVRRAGRMGATDIRLTTSAVGDDAASRFYESVGFELVRVLIAGSRYASKEYRFSQLIP